MELDLCDNHIPCQYPLSYEIFSCIPLVLFHFVISLFKWMILYGIVLNT